jgi:hypothetical protein
MWKRIRILAVAGLACAGLVLSACGDPDDDGGGSGGGGYVAGGGGDGGAQLTITSPRDGASVTNPVTLTFTSSEEIGPEDSGKHHVHVSIDGKTNDYTVVTSTSHRLENLPPGRHQLGVTLQHADHSDAGASAKVTVNVTGGGGGGGGTGNDGGGYGPGGNGY